MRGEVRSRAAGQSLQQLFRSQPLAQLKPFERLFRGDAVSRQKGAGGEPGHGTPDEGARGFLRFVNHPSRGERSGEGASP